MSRILLLFLLLLPSSSSFLLPSFRPSLFPPLNSEPDKTETDVVTTPTTEKAPFVAPPPGSSYVKCGRCQASFLFSDASLPPKSRGKYLECSVCSHSWYQSRGKFFELKEGFEFIEFEERSINRVHNNLKNNRPADFTGKSKLYVGNLSFNIKEEDLTEIFQKFGEVGDCSIVRDETGRSRGFAFVTMVEEDGGKKAQEGMDGEEVDGRVLQVREPN
ncbi:hypothetical protein TrVE_jg6060 [Triparma verrucosa]|uniref:RRM domain-containing protein n=1 Tax=Triparma verrucosa TaxID=1606542 RepID=A0A9W7EZS3_9STRA|nr:hypothetical protein TrVE_jg6060 [Triparma verrucosa]